MTGRAGGRQKLSVVGIFAEHVAERPDAVAVIDNDIRVTYRDLSRAAEAVRRRLLGMGMGPGSAVGISMKRSWRLIATIIGIMGTGASYVPLDMRYPEERLHFMCSDSDVRVLCTDDQAASVTPASTIVPVIVTGDLAEETISGEDARHAGYIIYTSGSTGRPKGVQIPQGHVVELFNAADQVFTFGPDDIWSLFHSYNFDFSVWEIWGALLHGGAVVVLSDDKIHDPRLLLPVLENERVSVLSQVPSVFKYLVRAYLRRPVPLRALRYIVFGGEALDESSVHRWLALRDGPEVLVNMYGITEATVHVTHARVTPGELGKMTATRIGRPLPHLRVMLLSADRVPVPPGQTGEMYIAGPTLSPGYLDDPGADAERFVTLDLGTGPERFYRSGDLAVRDADGDLFYLGRIDTQINLRGFRIEAGEIEAVLRECSNISDAVVRVVTTPAGDNSLAALVTVISGRQAPTDEELRQECERQLPAFMVPDYFRFVPEIPTTPTGKIDRSALAEAPLQGAGSAHSEPDRPSARASTPIRLAGAPFPASKEKPDHSRWMMRTQIRPDARIAVYCLPHAGGGASGYRDWAHALPAWAEVVAVQLPGRENRIADAPRIEVAEITAAVAADLDRHPTRSYALFGHSMGGLLAFELARLLAASGRQMPMYLGVSGIAHPALSPPQINMSGLPDRDLLAWAASEGGVPQQVLAEPQLQELIVRPLRADLSWLGKYVYQPGPLLSSPLTVFAGDEDESAQLDRIQDWRQETAGEFRIRYYPGGHFYLRSQLRALLGDLTADLMDCLGEHGGAG